MFEGKQNHNKTLLDKKNRKLISEYRTDIYMMNIRTESSCRVVFILTVRKSNVVFQYEGVQHTFILLYSC